MMLLRTVVLVVVVYVLIYVVQDGRCIDVGPVVLVVVEVANVGRD
jgi:hypothetical protein